MNKEIKAAIKRGLNALAKDQRKNGSFMGLTTTVFDYYKNSKNSPSIVPTNIVLSSLVNIPDAKKIKAKAAKFLLSQKGKYWSFNYWQKDSKEFKEVPYPDDLDDTFCALAALYEYNPKIFKGEAMGKIATLLTGTEIEEGGPYNMWVAPKDSKKWLKLDLVVNSNVAYFLYKNGVSLPKLDAYIEKCIKESNYEFPYYTIYPGIYFVSRFYKGEYVSQLKGLLLEKKENDSKWENPLRTALAISSLINLSKGQKINLDDSIKYLLKTQRKDGSWEVSSFYCELKRKEFTLYAGSSSITTALCLEALNKYIARETKATKQEDSKLYHKVINKAEEKFSSLSPDLGNKGMELLKKILKGDKNIVLISELFLSALGKEIDKEKLVKLSLANLYGWMAYTVYDDFLDGEGDQRYISIANVCLRASQNELEDALSDKGFVKLARSIFNEIDEANNWEVLNCRDVKLRPDFGDLSILAKKSMGHALGPIAILFLLGYRENSKEIKGVMNFFKHYLIARQLNDDAHDWQEDLKNKLVTPVVSMLLSEKKVGELEQVFWEKTILKVTKEMSNQVNLAEEAIKGLKVILDKKLLLSLLDPIKYSITKAKSDRKETIKFINTYKNE